MTLGNFLIDSPIPWSYRQDQRRKISFRAYPPRLTWPYARTSSLQMTVTLTVKEGKKYSNHWILRKLRGKTRQHWLPASWGGGAQKSFTRVGSATKYCKTQFDDRCWEWLQKELESPWTLPSPRSSIPCCWLTQIIRGTVIKCFWNWFCNSPCKLQSNWPFRSGSKPLYQSEAKSLASDMKTTFHCHAKKTHFYKVLHLASMVLKVKTFGPRKLSIVHGLSGKQKD